MNDPIVDIVPKGIVAKIQSREERLYTKTPEHNLTEAERRIIHSLRTLEAQDNTFRFFPQVIAERLAVAVAKGRDLNGAASGIMDQIFYAGDESAFHITFRNYVRLQQPIATYHETVPDDAILDRLIDGANYTDYWRCCRLERAEGPQANKRNLTDAELGELEERRALGPRQGSAEGKHASVDGARDSISTEILHQ